MSKECKHFTEEKHGIKPRTVSCEECEKEHLPVVAIRMCLTCGHVGCCDSSIGKHATKHFKETLLERRKELASALARKPNDESSTLRLTLALNRHLNKTDQGYEELREAVRRADAGEADVEQLLSLAKVFLNEQETLPDRKAIDLSLELLDEIAGALGFAGMEEEASIIDRCSGWLRAASKAGEVREDDAFRCFAEAFAQLELHLQRSVIDPLDDTGHMLSIAEQRSLQLEEFAQQLSTGAEVATGTFHKLLTTIGLPASAKARARLAGPSPVCKGPNPVLQASSTTSCASTGRNRISPG